MNLKKQKAKSKEEILKKSEKAEKSEKSGGRKKDICINTLNYFNNQRKTLYSLIITEAAPIPVPIHIEVKPNWPGSNNLKIVAYCLAPVQPIG